MIYWQLEQNIMKKLERAAEFGAINQKDLRRRYRKVAQIFVRKAKGMVSPYKKDIVVRPNKDALVVRRGQLRDSMGTWSPDNKFPTVLAGPRANHPMKRKVPDTADGWFAHIVEEGDFPDQFGGKSSSHPNYKIIERAMHTTQAQMRVKLQQELKQEFEKYMR
jgi:hypothetical protein